MAALGDEDAPLLDANRREAAWKTTAELSGWVLLLKDTRLTAGDIDHRLVVRRRAFGQSGAAGRAVDGLR